MIDAGMALFERSFEFLGDFILEGENDLSTERLKHGQLVKQNENTYK